MNILDVNALSGSYPIYIKKGLMEKIGEKIKKIYKNKKIAIITDENIEKLYGNQIEDQLREEGFLIKKIIIKPGEKSKSMQVLQNVYNELVDFSINRGSLIITFGGGVVGDLGGFAASTFLRGVPFVQIPTSFLAQIDSSLGGKVAVNLNGGKNLVGNFYQPKAVFIDPKLLETLDNKYMCDGIAEAIKYGAIKSKELFQQLSTYTEEEFMKHIEKIIYQCCEIKKILVEKDEKDTGERMLLNFGHTIGHGIEKYFQYEKYTHGEAVAMGMYEITKNSEMLGLTEKGTCDLIKDIFKKYNLAYKAPNMDENIFFETLKLDKKSIGENIHIVLLENIGNGFIEKIHVKDLKKYLNVI